MKDKICDILKLSLNSSFIISILQLENMHLVKLAGGHWKVSVKGPDGRKGEYMQLSTNQTVVSQGYGVKKQRKKRQVWIFFGTHFC